MTLCLDAAMLGIGAVSSACLLTPIATGAASASEISNHVFWKDDHSVNEWTNSVMKILQIIPLILSAVFFNFTTWNPCLFLLLPIPLILMAIKTIAQRNELYFLANCVKAILELVKFFIEISSIILMVKLAFYTLLSLGSGMFIPLIIISLAIQLCACYIHLQNCFKPADRENIELP